MAIHRLEADHGAAIGRAAGGDGVFGRLRQRFGSALRRWSERRVNRATFLRLRDLDDRQLRDIGLTRGEVDWAASLPLWRDAGLEAKQAAEQRRAEEESVLRR